MKRPVVIIIALVFVIAGAIIVTIALDVVRTAKETHEMSKMRFLGVVVANNLAGYYSTNNFYPETIHELGLTTNVISGEGATMTDLLRFTFESKSNEFTLTWDNPKYGYSFEGTGSNIFYINSTNRWEYK